MTLPVYALGFADTYAQFFNAIAATMGNDSYGALIKLAILLGGVWTLLVSSLKRNLSLNFKWIASYVIIMTLVLTPKATVQIIDLTSPGEGRAIANIPLGLGVLASFTSRIGVGLAQLVDDTFHTPNELDYTQSGMLFGAKLVLASTQFQITNPKFQKNLKNFVNQCIFYDLLLNKYSLKTLMDSGNIWQLVTSQASPARAFSYNGEILTCQKGANILAKDWKSALDNSSNRYAHMLFYDNKNAKASLISMLPTTYQYLANISQDASSLMQQTMMFQATLDGLDAWASKTNSSSALQSIAFAKAQQQKRQAYSMLYRMAVHWLPLMKIVLELLLYGMFIIVVFLAFFPIGASVIKNYVYAMIWVQLWAPLFAFVNFIFNITAQKFASSATLLPNGQHVLSLSTFSGLDQMLLDLGMTAGFMSMTVPFLTSGIFFGLMRVFGSISQLLGGAAQSMSFAAAGEAVTGNLSLGNTQIDTHSAHNMNANHWDTNARLNSGMLNYQLRGGSMASITPSGSTILNTQSGISSLPIRIGMAESISKSLSQSADENYSTGLRESQSASEMYSAGLRELYDLGSSQSFSKSSGDSSSLSSSAAISQSSREVHQLIDRFAHENHVSRVQASRVLGSVYGDVHGTQTFNLKDQLGGKVANWATGLNFQEAATLGAKFDRAHNWDTQNSALYNKAETFAKEHHFSQTVDNAIRVAQDNNFRSGSEESNREALSMASHFEEGNRFSSDATSSFEKSEALRTQSSLVQNESINIEKQATQEFVDWMLTQPAPGGRGTMDLHTMEGIMAHHPEELSPYIEQFIQDKKENYIDKFADDYSSERLQSSYRESEQVIGGKRSIEDARQYNDDLISQTASHMNVGNVKDNITKGVNAVRQAASTEIESARKESSNIVDQVEEARKKYDINIIRKDN